jgi:cytoskeleton protein RodZ
VDSGIGDTLREAREELGRDLDEAARELRAQRHHLEALEDERFDLFGGDVYAKGHLRSYARWLGLDPEPLVQSYRTDVEGAGYDPHALTEHPVARPSRPSLPGWVVWTALGALVLVAAFAVAGTLGGRAPEPVAGPIDGVTEEEEPPPADEPDDAAEPETEPEPEPEPTPEGVELVLIVEDRAWIRVVTDDQTHEGTYEPGEVLDFFDEEEIRVRLGNAGGVTFQLNDEVLGSPAGRGQVWEGVCTVDGCEEA